VRLSPIHVQHFFEEADSLSQRLSKHYLGQFLRQLYKILGSTDLLGNPVGFFSSLSDGIRDFVYEPVQGLTQSPAAFGKGVAKGTLSLVKNTVAGVVTTAGAITG
jgi:hypothetical protein